MSGPGCCFFATSAIGATWERGGATPTLGTTLMAFGGQAVVGCDDPRPAASGSYTSWVFGVAGQCLDPPAPVGRLGNPPEEIHLNDANSSNTSEVGPLQPKQSSGLCRGTGYFLRWGG